MIKKHNRNLIPKKEKLPTAYIVRIKKNQKRVNAGKEQFNQKTSLNKAIDIFNILLWFIVILIVILILFSIFIKFFSTLRLFFRVVIAASVSFPKLCKIVKKLNWVRTFFSNPDVKAVVEFFNSIKSSFKRIYNRNKFAKKAYMVIIFPIVASLIISFSPNISAKVNNAIDYVWNTVFDVLDDNGVYENANKDITSIYPEEEYIYTETTNYPLKMAAVIDGEKYSYEIPSNLIPKVYLSSVEHHYHNKNIREYLTLDITPCLRKVLSTKDRICATGQLLVL